MIYRFLSQSLVSFKQSLKESIQSLGIVFGDIGTSPIYTLSIIFLLTPATPNNILGILSMIVWTLILIVFAEYIVLVMSLGKKGEGGTIVLKELFIPMLKSSRSVAIASILSFIGISLLFGDGVLTPAMGILSALEGLKYLKFVQCPSQTILLILATGIAIILFVLQKLGIEKVSIAFGPLMLIWFLTLAISGIFGIMTLPIVLKAINPL